MPRIHTAKKSNRGKELKCKRCGKKINPGDTYRYYTRRFSRMGKGVRYNHCMSCPPKPTDLSSSPMAEVEEAQAEAHKAIDAADNTDDMMQALEDLKSVAEDVKGRAEESLENMPEGLRESSDSGNTLQERIDGLDSYISELESVSLDEIEAPEEKPEPKEGEPVEDSKEDDDEEDDLESQLEAARETCREAIDSLSL